MILWFICMLCFNSVTFAAPLVSFEAVTKNILPCGDQGDCLTASPVCNEPCGCDKLYYLNKTTNQCMLDFEYLKNIMIEKFNTQDKLHFEAERVFGGIIVSVIIFGTCTALCALSACLYCAHINYSDRKLRKDVKALSQKLKRDGKLPTKQHAKKTIDDKGGSCTVVVEDAGVFVC